ncbi:MAG: hypothetical protein P4L81_00170 [Candidatus Pacebacteria bacterium]|nr:hypothetical protein [Candidatus Paceibacterota bacterium]
MMFPSFLSHNCGARRIGCWYKHSRLADVGTGDPCEAGTNDLIDCGSIDSHWQAPPIAIGSTTVACGSADPDRRPCWLDRLRMLDRIGIGLESAGSIDGHGHRAPMLVQPIAISRCWYGRAESARIDCGSTDSQARATNTADAGTGDRQRIDR